jgi:hypothetical protein
MLPKKECLKLKLLLSVVVFIGICSIANAQLVINEGSNKNYSTILDEDGDAEDWIEIYNAGNTAVDLFNYSLSDNSNPGEWRFTHQIIQPNEHILVFCSGKDRNASTPFTQVFRDTTFQPQTGWNVHHFTTPFYWDGISNVMVNICIYDDGYTNNSIHLQSATTYNATMVAVADGTSACNFPNGGIAKQRPNLRLNGAVIGTGSITNSTTDYPAPYGNWYWSARQQFLIHADELIAAGLTAGPIDSLSFDIVAAAPVVFSLLEIGMANTGINEFTDRFIPEGGNKNHTNFKISSDGEKIRLYNPSNALISTLNVHCGEGYDVSIGTYPDGASTIRKFAVPTPGASNSLSAPADNYAPAPLFSVNSGIYSAPLSVNITIPSTPNAATYYTLDGSDPDGSAMLWNGTPVLITQSAVLRARTFINGYLPSNITAASYLFNINHTTPVISVMTDPDNLFGPSGMFDFPTLDLLKAASVDYFDETADHNLLFSRRAGIVMDGGWGSRGLPQRPFRIEFDHGVLGQGPVTGNFIPGRPNRNQYSRFFLRNGSNQYLVLPHKDAAQGKMMGDGAYAYYSASRPVTVYINGAYWGLYDLREKFDTEMFETLENADPKTVEILSSSAQYGFTLRAVEGDVQHFYDAYDSFAQLNPQDSSFWTKADQYFDMIYYNDYIIAETWMGNADWAFNYNNLKIYRSDATDYRWRYCLMDLEYGLLPNPFPDGSINCHSDFIYNLLNADVISTPPNNPHLNIWLKGVQNDRFRNYFINRYADQMNSLYQLPRMLAIEDSIYHQVYPEVANQYARWGDPSNIPGQLDLFNYNHNLFKDELTCRTPQVRNHIQTNFNLPQQVDVQLDVHPSNTGKINISTITPDEYPWQGVYFDGVPVQITAQAMPGYQFSHWEANGLITDTLNAVFLDTLTTDKVLFKAHFVSTTSVQDLSAVSFEVYPNPASDKVHIRAEDGLGALEKLWLVDLLGKSYSVPVTVSGNREYAMSVSSLPKGYYVIHCLSQNGKIFNTPFVKSK